MQLTPFLARLSMSVLIPMCLASAAGSMQFTWADRRQRKLEWAVVNDVQAGWKKQKHYRGTEAMGETTEGEMQERKLIQGHF